MALKVKKEIPIQDYVVEYDNLRTQSKTIKSRMDTLSTILKDFAEKMGTKDDKGSFYTNVSGFLLGKQCKKSIAVDTDKAIAFLKGRRLNDAIKVTESVNEEVLEKYVADGIISYDDLESITTTKVTYAIDLKKEEEMPVVEQTSYSVAASKKPTIKRK